MTTRIGPDQAVHPQTTTKRAKSKALFRKSRVITMKAFWPILFCFIAAIVAYELELNAGVFLVSLPIAAALGGWVASEDD